MRILHILESLDCGGMERMVIELGVSQRSKGHEVRVACLFEPGDLAGEACSRGLLVTAFHRAQRRSFSVLLRLISYVCNYYPHVVLTHNGGVHAYGAIAARLTGVPFVVNVRHSPTSSAGLPFNERRFRATLPITDLSVCVSQHTADTLIKQGILKPDQTQVIRNGVDATSFLGSPATPGASTPRFLIGALGRLVPVKQYEFLLEAFAVLLKRISTIELHIAGTGPLRSSLERVAGRLNITAQTHFLGQVNAVEFLRTLDLFVCCSSSEGLPVSVLEAMAAGLPIVSRALPGVQEAAPADSVAWYADTADPIVFAGVVHEALSSGELAIRGGRARSIARDRFDIRTTCENYERLLAALPACRG
jgi:glycosyltransferase involved in cell wall biosynthesis